MTYSPDTIPSDFPLGYVISTSNEHQLYVKERWKGLHGVTYADRNPDGSVGDFWLMGCLLHGCDSRGSVLTTSELHALLKSGRIVGTYRDGVVIVFTASNRK